MELELTKLFTDLTEIARLGPQTGQKDVFRAKMGDAAVALKIFKEVPEGEMDRQAREALVPEKLKSITGIKLSYVPPVHRSGQCELQGSRRHFLIEDLIDGQPYDVVLRSTPKQPLANVRKLTTTLLTAACDFEQAKLVHRDIKPANIMLDVAGNYWVIDFGIARHLDLASLTPTASAWGMGTLGYAPWEQWKNRKTEIGIRTDLFSMGMVLYESLNGSNPYLREPRHPVSILNRTEKEDLPALEIEGDPGGEFALLIQSLTARFPSRRPATAKEALAWFESIRFS